MAKYDLETLKELSKNLMFTMEEQQYLDLLDEFKVMLKQLKLLDDIVGVNNAEPMDFPYLRNTGVLREDTPENIIKREEALDNAGDTFANQIKLPKVVK